MNELTTYNAAIWGGDNVQSEDISIPSILLMQATNNLVASGVANVGEIIDSSTKEVLAKRNEAMEFIPLMANTEWVMQQKDEKNQWRKVKVVEGPPEAVGRKWTLETVVDGKPTKFSKVLHVFLAIPGKMDEMPRYLSLKGMSVGAAQTIGTHVFMKNKFQKPIADTVFKLSNSAHSFNGITQLAFEVSKLRPTTQEELTTACQWREMLVGQKSKVVLDDSAEVEAQEVSKEEVPF